MMRVSIHCLSMALALSVLTIPPLRAETVACTSVTSLPATISTQGVYCLKSNLVTSMGTDHNAITIRADNVTLDLNGWRVDGQAAGSGTLAVGIFSEAANVIIKNGIVRGFSYGIYLYGRGALVRDMLVDQNTFVGVYVAGGMGVVIEHNRVIDTGGSTATPNSSAYGIFAESLSNYATISNNIVSGLTAMGNGDEYGIKALGLGSTVRDNVVSDTARPTGRGISYGIYQSRGSAVNNIVSNFDWGIYDYLGIYAHNTVYACQIPYWAGSFREGNSY